MRFTLTKIAQRFKILTFLELVRFSCVYRNLAGCPILAADKLLVTNTL
jgi:hypothetical protein